MPFASQLKLLGLAAAMSAGLFAAAQVEIAALRPATTLPIDAGLKPAPVGHRRPDAGGIPRDEGQDPVIRNEEEFDRAFGMCRRC